MMVAWDCNGVMSLTWDCYYFVRLPRLSGTPTDCHGMPRDCPRFEGLPGFMIPPRDCDGFVALP